MKVLVSDLDGTLVQDKKLDELVLLKLTNFLEEGNKFIIATGRPYQRVRHLQTLAKASYSICCNGAAIIDENGEVIYNKPMSKEDIDKIVNVYSDDLIMFYSNGVDISKITSNDEVISEDTVFFSLGYKDKSVEKIINLEEYINQLGLNVTCIRNGHNLDIGISGVSKGNAIMELVNLGKFKKEEVMVTGDNFNDISMMELFEESYAISDGEEAVKEIAKYQVSDVGMIIDPTVDWINYEVNEVK